MKQLTVLGSTGSIGCSTLDVVRHNPDRFSIAALVAGKMSTAWLNNVWNFLPAMRLWTMYKAPARCASACVKAVAALRY